MVSKSIARQVARRVVPIHIERTRAQGGKPVLKSSRRGLLDPQEAIAPTYIRVGMKRLWLDAWKLELSQ